jgi:hypothetical protein
MADERSSWRTRLGLLVAALGTSLFLTTGSAPKAATTSSASQVVPLNSEVRIGKTRLAKLIFRRSGQGTLKLAQHESHSSHSSHGSHTSHSSGYWR